MNVHYLHSLWKTSIALIGIGMLIVYAPTAHAENCGDLPTQSAMNRCYATEVRAKEEELEKSLHKLAEQLSEEQLAALYKAKEQWDAYKKAQCAFNSAATEGGSIHSMMIALCYLRLTEEYLTLINEQLHCEEGDLSCVH